MSQKPNTAAPHLRQQGSARQLIVEGQPLVMLAGEIHNSSASNLAYMAPLWNRLAGLGLNTVLAPLYWELIEPREGRFDFALLDGLVKGARQHGLRLVFLWFGTWKNAKSSYAPEWVKLDQARFARAQRQPGENTNTITCLSEEACAADARAFAAVMRRIRRIDAGRQTVIAIQVQNETGMLETSRDRCPAAEAAFRQSAPNELMDWLAARIDALRPEFREAWTLAGGRASGTWSEVFGDWADETFMAWHTARFVDRVAAAGKREYDLPMFANAWLSAKKLHEPGQYPSGGPVPRMHDIWRAAAPHIDVLAPDIYHPDFRGYCEAFAQGGNPLLVPEARRDARCAAAVFYALAQHDAICFAPFGIEDLQALHPLTDSYRLLAELLPLIVERQGMGRMAGFLQQEDSEVFRADLGVYRLRVKTVKPLRDGETPGGGLVIELAPDEFLIAGRQLSFEFFSKSAERPNVEFLALDEGRYEGGKWIAGRRLNGDESGHGRWVNLGAELCVRRCRLYCYS